MPPEEAPMQTIRWPVSTSDIRRDSKLSFVICIKTFHIKNRHSAQKKYEINGLGRRSDRQSLNSAIIVGMIFYDSRAKDRDLLGTSR